MTSTIEKYLGMAGRMLSNHKRNPPGTEDHTIYWNACVFVRYGRKDIRQEWWGDLDVTERTEALKALAHDIGHTVIVTPEQPWRFDGFEKASKPHHPKFDRPIFTFTA